MLTNAAWEIRDKLLYPRAVLELLRQTDLFGEELKQALRDIDYVIEQIDQGRLGG